MKPDVAIGELETLKGEVSDDPKSLSLEGRLQSWRARVDAVLNHSLSPQSAAVRGFRSVSYHFRNRLGIVSYGYNSEQLVEGVQRAIGYIDAAIYELKLLTGGDEPVDQRAFDPELWDHVRELVDAEDWGKVASQTAIFVEDRVRIWARYPKDAKGDDLIGKGLWSKVLADAAEYRLGQRAGEWEGWKFLGMGFAQALSNVDRHRIQKRNDARRYAIGVLGLGSLLLTQLRFEHSDILNEE